jgi:signal peptidase II
VNRSTRPILTLIAVVSALVGCDHATKVVAESALHNRPNVSVVRGVLDLEYSENGDVAFNALSRVSLHPSSWVLAAGALAITAMVVAAWARKRRRPWGEHAAFALVLAGALGNAIDRMAHGHVVDFIHIRFWPIFNVADIAIVVGLMGFWWLRARAPRSVGTSR